MNQKTKNRLLSLAVRTAIAVVIFVILFVMNRLFPQLIKHMERIWTKSMDIQKIGTFLKEVLKESLP